MHREWIADPDGESLRFKREALLNYGMNRWGLNKAASVDKVSELIRRAAPSSIEDWECFYFENARQQKRDGARITREFLEDMRGRLYVKLSEVVQSELGSITEAECIDYVFNLVINRTYNGYINEIETVYGQLQELLGVPILPAPDEWDRLYNVDFFIRVGERSIGLQVKPISFDHMMEDHRWKKMQETTHSRFKQKYGGSVFMVFSVRSGKKKVIRNMDVVDAIRSEMESLKL